MKAKVDEAAPWFKLSYEEKKQQEAQAHAAEEKRLADEKAKQVAEAKAKAQADAAAKAQAEAEAKKGYETGITYDQIARTPDSLTGKKVKFHGKVVQVIEDDSNTQIRLAVADNYETILFGQFDKSAVTSRVLKNDEITIYGTSTGMNKQSVIILIYGSML